MEGLLARAIEDEKKGVGGVSLTFMPEALKMIASHAQGDARRALDLLEASVNYAHQNKIDTLTTNIVETTLCSKMPLYDKDGEGHYNIIGAFIKSMRGSDPDAAIYYMMRMLDAGEDPLFILRRMIIFASEDIGNADTHALPLAVAADTAFQRVGMPEGIYPLAHCCLYLATAPKSNLSQSRSHQILSECLFCNSHHSKESRCQKQNKRSLLFSR